MVIKNKFQPFSLERYLLPLTIYGQAYNEAQNTYDTLSAQADLLKARAAEEPNSLWSKRYNDYANELLLAAEDLYNNGLTPQVKSRVSNVKRGYSSSVKNALDAIEQLRKLSDELYKMNPSLRMEHGSMPSIDALIGDMSIKPVSYSGAAVELSAQLLAAAASTRKTSESFNTFKDYWMRKALTTGFNDRDVSLFLQDSQKIPELNAIIGQVTSLFNNFDGLNDNQKKKMAAEIMSGILKGATYKQQTDYQLDPLEIARQKFAMEHPLLNSYTPVTPQGNPYDLAERLDVNKSYAKHNEYAKYFDKDGNLTNEGWELYNKTIPPFRGRTFTDPMPSATAITTDSGVATGTRSEFKIFMDSLNDGKPIKNREDFRKLYKLNAERLNSLNINADTIVNKVFKVKCSDLNDIKNSLFSGNNNGIVQTYKLTKEGYKPDENINLSDSKFKNATYSGEYGISGNYIVVTTTDNEQYRIPLLTVHEGLNARLNARFDAIMNSYKEAELRGIALDLVLNTGKGFLSYNDRINLNLNESLNDFVKSFQSVKAKDYTVE